MRKFTGEYRKKKIESVFINKECSQKFPNYPKIGTHIPKDSANVGGKILLLLFGEK